MDIDYVSLYGVYRNLPGSTRSVIEGADTHIDLVDVQCGRLPAMYILLGKAGIKPEINSFRQIARAVWFFPMLGHKEGIRDIGSILRSVSPGQIDMMCELTESDVESLQQLRYAIQSLRRSGVARLSVDWDEMGRRLYYWGKGVRSRIRREYYFSRICIKSGVGQ